MAAAAERERERAERAAELAAAAAAFSSPADESESALTEEEQEAAASAATNASAAAAAASADNPADDSQDDSLYPPLAPFLRLELCDLPADCVDEALMLRLLACLQAPPGRPVSDATPLQVCSQFKSYNRFQDIISLLHMKRFVIMPNASVRVCDYHLIHFIYLMSIIHIFLAFLLSLYIPICLYLSFIRRCCSSDPPVRRRPTWPPTPCCLPRAAA